MDFVLLIYPLKCQNYPLGVDNKHHWPFFHIKLSAEEETIPLCCGHPLFFSDSEWESNCFQAKQVWRGARTWLLLLFTEKRDSIYSTLIMTKKSPYLKGQMDSHILFCFLNLNIEILNTKRPLLGGLWPHKLARLMTLFPPLCLAREQQKLPKRSSNPFVIQKKSCLSHPSCKLLTTTSCSY